MGTASATGTRRKTAAKKSKGGSFELTMELARETKNTLRYETDEEGAAINPLYIQKSALDGSPESITVTVTF